MDKLVFQKKIGQHIAHLRRQQGLSQVQLADLLDKEKQSINRLEMGHTNPTAFLLYQIAQALNLPLNTLLHFTITDSQKK